MKKLKKLLSISISLILVLTCIQPVFAATTFYRDDFDSNKVTLEFRGCEAVTVEEIVSFNFLENYETAETGSSNTTGYYRKISDFKYEVSKGSMASCKINEKWLDGSEKTNQNVNILSSKTAKDLIVMITGGIDMNSSMGTIRVVYFSPDDVYNSVSDIKIMNDNQIVTEDGVILTLEPDTNNNEPAELNFTPSVIGEDSSRDATNKSVIWSLEGCDSVSLNMYGTTCCVKQEYDATVTGTAILTVKSTEDTSKTVSIPIKIEEAAPEINVDSVQLSPAVYCMKPSDTKELSSAVEPANAPQTVTWESSDTSIATVDGNGNVTAVAPGNATITATSTKDTEKKATSQIIVSENTNHLVNITNSETGSVDYDSLSDALAALKADDTLKLLNNVNIDYDITIDKNCIIDLNNKIMAFDSKTITTAAETEVSIKNGSILNTQLIVNGKLKELNAVTMTGMNGSFTLDIRGSGSADKITGCDISSQWLYAISTAGPIEDISETILTAPENAINVTGNGNNSATVVSVNSGTYITENADIFKMQNAVIYVNGGKFKIPEGKAIGGIETISIRYPYGKTISNIADMDGYYSLTNTIEDSTPGVTKNSEVTVGDRITSGGTYTVKAGTKDGTITVNTTEAVTLVGNGNDEIFNNVTIECKKSATNLTIKNMFISRSTDGNVINFTGKDNRLNIEGTCDLEFNNNNAVYALIHVGSNESLTINVGGTLYMYKNTMSACVGGNNQEMNGAITIDGNGTIYAKNTKQGAMFGGGPNSAGTGTPGDITVNGGELYLIGNSRAAIFGGAAGSTASAGGNFYINGGTITMNVDFSGAAVGGGGYDGGNDASGGTMYYDGGSIRTYADLNAVNDGGWSEKGISKASVSDKLITATKVTKGKDAYLCVFNTAYLKTKASNFNVKADGSEIYSGGTHKYHYVNEDKEKDSQIAITSTPSNWESYSDDNIYFYLTEGTHTLIINNETFTATYDANAEQGSFIVTTSSGSATRPGSYGSSTGVKQDPETTQPEVSTEIKPDVAVSENVATTTVNKENIDQAITNVGTQPNTNIVIDAVSNDPAVTKSEVNIPKESVNEVKNGTSADLVVSTDLGKVAVSNADLPALTGTDGENVNVVLEKNENGSVNVSVTVDGNSVPSDKNILKVTVKVPDSVMADSAGSANTNPNLVAVLVDKNGNQTIVKNSVITSDGYAKLLMGTEGTVSVINNSRTFGDVASDAWFNNAVAFASSHELFKGISDSEFGPSVSMTRGMFVTVLSRLTGAEDYTGTSKFTDVTADQWYSKSVAWASANNVVSGYGNGMFGPDDSITREQMAVILYNYVQAMGLNVSGSASLDNFSDAESVDEWALDAMQWAYGTGLMEGNADGTLNPLGNATRAEVATIMENFVNIMLK